LKIHLSKAKSKPLTKKLKLINELLKANGNDVTLHSHFLQERTVPTHKCMSYTMCRNNYIIHNSMSTLGFLRCAKNIETVAPVLHIVRLILTNSTTPDTRQSMVISQSLTLAVLMAILPGEPEIAGFIEAKDEKTGCDK